MLDGHLLGNLHYNEPTDQQLEFDSNEFYTARHQFGGMNLWQPCPPLGLFARDEGENWLFFTTCRTRFKAGIHAPYIKHVFKAFL